MNIHKQSQPNGQFLTVEEIQEIKSLFVASENIELSEEQSFDQGRRLIMCFELMQKFNPVLVFGKDAVDIKFKRKENLVK